MTRSKMRVNGAELAVLWFESRPRIVPAQLGLYRLGFRYLERRAESVVELRSGTLEVSPGWPATLDGEVRGLIHIANFKHRT